MNGGDALWKGGLPTGPEVEMLLKMWDSLKVGDRIPYQDVEELLGLERKSRRFDSITRAWRHRLVEKGLVVDCIPGLAFVVLDHQQIFANTPIATKTAQKRLKKQRTHLATIRTDDPLVSATRDHQARLMHAMERDLKKTRMNLLPATEVQERPKIKPPQSSESTEPKEAKS